MKTQFYFSRFLLSLLFLAAVFAAGAQTSISLLGPSPGGGPAATGPVTTNQAVTMYTNTTTAFTPAITATYSITNQQYASIEGNAGTPGTVFGGTVSATVNAPAPGDPVYNLMNAFGGAASNQFTVCNTCTAGTGIDVTTHRAVNIMAYTDALIDAAGNQPSTTGRFHYADLTVTFNRPVSNPVLRDSRFTYSPVIAININCNERGISAFPNPVRDYYTLRGLSGGEVIQLYNATGQLLQTRQVTNYQTDIDFSRYQNGIYLLNVINMHGEKTFQAKVIKSE